MKKTFAKGLNSEKTNNNSEQCKNIFRCVLHHLLKIKKKKLVLMLY